MNLREVLMTAAPADELRAVAKAGALPRLEPALAALRMDPRPGYHHKDVWEHSLQVLEQAQSREGGTPSLILRTAALLHDVGKPATRAFGPRGVVSFQNHEVVGARQAKGLLAHHGYSLSERKAVASLVRLHMRAYGFADTQWTDSGLRRLEHDAGGAEALSQLLILFRSDITTKNSKKAARILRGLDRLEEELARVREQDSLKARRPPLNGHQVMEATGLSQGRELGALMKRLNQEDMLAATEAEAWATLRREFPQVF